MAWRQELLTELFDGSSKVVVTPLVANRDSVIFLTYSDSAAGWAEEPTIVSCLGSPRMH